MDSLNSLDMQIPNQLVNAIIQDVFNVSQQCGPVNQSNNLSPISPMHGVTADNMAIPEGGDFGTTPDISYLELLEDLQTSPKPEEADFDVESVFNAGPQWTTLQIQDERFKDCHKMLLRAYYQKYLLGYNDQGLEVDTEDGFVVFHKQPCHEHSKESVAHVELPDLTQNIVGISQKVSDLTMKVLGDMAKGLYVQYRDGFIWATRYCTSRVFFWCTQLNQTQSVKLERGEQTKVFDFAAYFNRLEQLKATGRVKDEKSPKIVFTFGQQWNGSSSNLRDMYVRVEVKPMKAVERLTNINGGQYCESIAKSIQEDDIQSSIDGSVMMQ